MLKPKKKPSPRKEQQEEPEKAKGYIISDQKGMQMHYEPKPRYKHGGMCRGTGAAIKGKKFGGVF